MDRLGLSTSPGAVRTLNSICLWNMILFQIKQNHVTISFSMKSCWDSAHKHSSSIHWFELFYIVTKKIAFDFCPFDADKFSSSSIGSNYFVLYLRTFRLILAHLTDKRSKPKGITTFFSKRCLPPARESISASESSPQQCPKTEVFPGDGTQWSGA